MRSRDAFGVGLLAMTWALCAACQSGPPLIPGRPIISSGPEQDDADRVDQVGAAGFEILAAWGYDQKEQPSYVAARGDSLYWMDGSRALSVRPHFGTPRSMNARVPPASLVEANERGVYWLTPTGELWQVLVQDLRPRRLWQCPGKPYLLELDRDSAYVGLESVPRLGQAAWELWRIDLQGAQARRVGGMPNEVIWSLLVDGDWLYFSSGGIAGRLMRAAKAGGAAQIVAAYPMNRILEAADGANVYWWDDHGVFRSPKYGGREVELMTTPEGIPGRTAIDASELFWVEGQAGLYSAPLAGGQARRLVALPEERDCRPRVEGASVQLTCEHAVYRVAKHPGPFPRRARAEWQGISTTMAVTPTHLYWTERRRASSSEVAIVGWKKDASAPVVLGREAELPDSRLVADATHLYYRLRDGTVKRIARSGGAPELIVAGSRVIPSRSPIPEAALNFSQAFHTLALDGDHVYWIAQSQGAVLRAEKSGGVPQVLADGLDTPVALTVDAGQVYFLTAGTEHFVKEWGSVVRDEYHHDGRLLRVPATGGAIVTMAKLPYLPSDLAITGQSIYVSLGPGDGELFRLPKAGGEARQLFPLGDNHVGAIFATNTTLFFSLEPGLVAKLVDGAAAPIVLASGLGDAGYFGWDGETLFFALANHRHLWNLYPEVDELVALPVVADSR